MLHTFIKKLIDGREWYACEHCNLEWDGFITSQLESCADVGEAAVTHPARLIEQALRQDLWSRPFRPN